MRTRAAEAVREHPRDHMFHLRLSTGEFLCGHYDPALEQVDTALELLPAIGWRGSHQLLLEQFTSQRTAILQGRATARRDAERQERLDHHERTIEDLVGNVRRSLLRSVELVTTFAAVIAFAVGSLQITLNGNLDLKGRAILMAEPGGGLLLFALVIAGGSWLITRNLSTARGNDEE
ncbi:hypothetical protein [Nocardia puris]|uniref:Tetratricopeptide repeat protein n=1 Tax=Nocardia puris TaxID=208602 RepID=A0A366DBE9_9NOCA|nr:hypothetical protein [Nocardia puris]RBO86578.1 hypothetical protein DFR74_113121 [Nocardia puris]